MQLQLQAGLRIYLKRYEYKNAVTEDLWKALSESSGEVGTRLMEGKDGIIQDISALMSGWTKQMGFPVVSVNQTIDGTSRILKLRQERFLADGKTDPANQLWQVYE